MERRRFLTLGGLAHASAPLASLVRAQTYGSPIDPTAAKLDAATAPVLDPTTCPK